MMSYKLRENEEEWREAVMTEKCYFCYFCHLLSFKSLFKFYLVLLFYTNALSRSYRASANAVYFMDGAPAGRKRRKTKTCLSLAADSDRTAFGASFFV
jgi:hypothetical protein